ncbi:MAG: TonB-dependent receptor [Salinivirgaceae bacterium]|nr:TonB-dependent receptor [Salinivirgaceae bacterium]
MKILSTVSLLLLITTLLNSQTITILDETDLQSIENVMVFGSDQKKFQLSNLNGSVDISIFKKADEIYFQHPSYELKKMTYNSLVSASKVYLHENNIKISEVVIAANKWAQNRSEISAKITSITSKQIELQAPQTSADLIGSSGEVFIQKSQQGGGSPMIRGFSTNRLLISVDGVRMNTAIFRAGNVQNIISIDPFSIEQTEVLFGPGSVIYGSDAIGGVMSFSTLTPKLSQNGKALIKGSAVTRYGSASNEMTGHADFNIGWKKIGLLTSISYNKFGDLKMGSHGPDDYLKNEYVERINGIDSVLANDDTQVQVPSGYSQINLMQKVRFSPNKNWDVNYGFIYSETSDYSRYDKHLQYKSGTLKYGEWSYGPQIWSMNTIEVKNYNSNQFYDEVSFRFSRQFFEESRIDRQLNKKTREVKTEKVWAYSSNIDFHRKLNDKNQLFYGVEWVLNDVDSKGYSEDIFSFDQNPVESRYPNSDWNSYAVYATYSSQIFEKLRLNLGSRYNYFTLNSAFDTALFNLPFTSAEINQGALTGSVGLVYNPINDCWINTNVSTGFRSPNVDDIGKIFEPAENTLVIPNADLDAEYAYNAELSVSNIFADVVKIELTGYYTLLNNAMVRRPFKYNGQDSIIFKGDTSLVVAIQNAANAHVVGLEAGIDAKLPLGFTLKSRFNVQKGEEEMEDGTVSPSRHAAPWFGTTHLVYSVQKFKCDLYAVYSGEVSYDNLPYDERGKTYIYALDENDNPYSPAWFTLNLKSIYQINKNFSLTASIENILDKRYKPYSSGLGAPGRNFILALKAKF